VPCSSGPLGDASRVFMRRCGDLLIRLRDHRCTQFRALSEHTLMRLCASNRVGRCINSNRQEKKKYATSQVQRQKWMSNKKSTSSRSFERCMGGSGIRSAVAAVVGLCSRWEAGSLPQRVCGAMSLGDCMVGTWGFYADPVSPARLFDFFAGNLVVS